MAGATIAASAHIGEANTWAARSSCVVGSNYYTLVEQSSGPLLMRKSTDKGATYATVDAANGPTPSALTPPAGSYDTYRFGTDIYVVYQFATGSVGRVRVFHTATDLWHATDVGSASINTACDFQRPVRVAVRSDGDVLVWRYNGTGLQMAKWQPSVWNNTTALAAGYPHDLIMTSADVAIGTYKDTAGNDESWVTVTGADVQASGDFDTTAHTTSHPRGGQMATYNDGTNDKFFTLSLDATGSTMDGYHSTASAAPSGSLVNALTGVTPQLGSWACAAYNGQVYVVWAEANLIKYRVSTSLTNFTFAAEVTLISGTTDTDPLPTILADDAGSVLTVIYQDAGDVKHEYIVAPTVPAVELAFAADGTSTTAFSIAIAKPIALAADGVSTTALALAVAKPVALASDGFSTATFALAVAQPLALAADALSTATFALTTGAIIALDVASDGVATANFAAAVAKPIAVAGDGVSTATFSLAVAKPLAIAADGISTSSFDLTVAGGVAFGVAADGTSTAAFALAVSKPLALAADGIGTAAFDLATGGEVTLAVVSAGQSTAAFALVVSKPLAVSAAGSSTTAFDARVARLLGLTVLATSEATFAAAVDVRLALAVTRQSTASFDLLIGEPIVGMRFSAPGRVTVLVSHERSELETAIRATRLAADPTIRSG